MLVPALEKHEVASSFGRAAATYDQVASLQRLVASEMLLSLENFAAPGHLLDIGCGTGFVTRQLSRCFPQSRCVAVDIAFGMLQHCQSQFLETPPVLVCADAACLPFVNHSFDLIASNFVLQWCDDLFQVFSECFRVLSPDGRFLFSMPVNDTLIELKKSWGGRHVNDFRRVDAVLVELERAGFLVRSVRVASKRVLYDDPLVLAKELKSLGAHNVHAERLRGLTGKQSLRAMKTSYEQYRRADGKVPATWEVVMIDAWRPGESFA